MAVDSPVSPRHHRDSAYSSPLMVSVVKRTGLPSWVICRRAAWSVLIGTIASRPLVSGTVTTVKLSVPIFQFNGGKR
jgi:hypothetical protein